MVEITKNKINANSSTAYAGAGCGAVVSLVEREVCAVRVDGLVGAGAGVRAVRRGRLDMCACACCNG